MDRNKNKQPIQEKICCQNKTKKKDKQLQTIQQSHEFKLQYNRQ